MSNDNFNAAFDREEQLRHDRDYEQWLDDTADSRESIAEQAELRSHKQQLSWRRRYGLEPQLPAA